jgi:hypothetical protein
MKEIQLSKGKVALVSDQDYEFLSQWKWCASNESRGTKWYAIRWSRKSEHGEGKPYKIRMHRVLMGLPPKDDSVVVDHKDRNGLNNQRENLEMITQVENMHRSPGWKGSRTWSQDREVNFRLESPDCGRSI